MHSVNKTVERFNKILKEFPQFKYVGDPMLRTPCTEVSQQEAVEIGQELGETLVRYRKFVGYGRGLAASQIGIPKAVFVTFVEDHLEVYANSVIKHESDSSNFYREWCLSSGIYWGDIRRPERITMEYLASSGKRQTINAESFLARLLQHEHGHTQGELCIDIAESGSLEIATGDPLIEKLRQHPIRSSL